jgi:Protein of unknown function (DUF3307)
MTHATLFAATLAALYALHAVADHWVQTDRQATTKGGLGWPARLAALRHVLTYTATLAAGLALVGWVCQLGYDMPRVALALALNGITHYVADRRTPLIRLAIRLGKGGWLEHDREAPYKLDQSWHLIFLLATALIAS